MSQNSSEQENPRPDVVHEDGSHGSQAAPGTDAGPGDDAAHRPKPQFTEKQLKRLNTPVGAMVVSILALVALTLPFVWMQPHPDNQTYRPQVDVHQTASDAAREAGYPVTAPEMGEGWHTNFARWNPNQSEGVPFWEMGTTTPSGQFLTVTQTRSANPTWEAERAENDQHVGTVRAGGVDWDHRASKESRDGKDQATTTYLGTVRGTTVMVHGTGSEEEVRALAEKAADEKSAVAPSAGGSQTPSPAASAS